MDNQNTKQEQNQLIKHRSIFKKYFGIILIISNIIIVILFIFPLDKILLKEVVDSHNIGLGNTQPGAIANFIVNTILILLFINAIMMLVFSFSIRKENKTRSNKIFIFGIFILIITLAAYGASYIKIN